MHYAIINWRTNGVRHKSESLTKASNKLNPGTVCGQGYSEPEAMINANTQAVAARSNERKAIAQCPA